MTKALLHPHSGRRKSYTHLKWHVTGTLCGEPVSKKYLSLQTFLDEYGADNTVLNLNRSKLQRLRSGHLMKPPAEWDIVFHPIREERRVKHIDVYFDEAE